MLRPLRSNYFQMRVHSHSPLSGTKMTLNQFRFMSVGSERVPNQNQALNSFPLPTGLGGYNQPGSVQQRRERDWNTPNKFFRTAARKDSRRFHTSVPTRHIQLLGHRSAIGSSSNQIRFAHIYKWSSRHALGFCTNNESATNEAVCTGSH